MPNNLLNSIQDALLERALFIVRLPAKGQVT